MTPGNFYFNSRMDRPVNRNPYNFVFSVQFIIRIWTKIVFVEENVIKALKMGVLSWGCKQIVPSLNRNSEYNSGCFVKKRTY